MTRFSYFLSFFVAGSLLSTPTSRSSAGNDLEESKRPDILLIYCDDMGYGDAGFLGATDIQTPNLDRLAKGGVVFSHGYVTYPVCGPSRAGLLTGRNQSRFGMEINVSHAPYDLNMGLPLDQRTIADRLNAVGYRTGIIGKWHLGAAPRFHPLNRGFDYFFGHLGGSRDYWDRNTSIIRPLTDDRGNPIYGANEGNFLPLIRNERTTDFEGYLTHALSRDAVKFIKDTDNKTPLFLYLAYNAPHTPLQAPTSYIEKYRFITDTNRRVYAAMMDAMDEGIGKVLYALETTGRLENTLIFFISDNGGATDWGANNGLLRGGKGELFEGGIRVPFLAHWPAYLPTGKVYDNPMTTLDAAATILAAGNGCLDGPTLEGIDLAPFLREEKSGLPHETLYWRMRNGAGWVVRHGPWKYVKHVDGHSKPELYHLENDPSESLDLADNYPDVTRDLAERWNKWNQDNVWTIHLQASSRPGEYLEQRLRMYEQWYNRLEKETEHKMPIRAK